MKVFQYILPVLLTSLAVPALAGEKIDKVLPASGDSNISIESPNGEVSITGWDKNQVWVKGELDDNAEGFTFEQKGSLIAIKVMMPHNSNNRWNEQGSDLTIFVPKNARVDFGGVSSDVTLADLTRNVEVKTVSGDLKGKNLSNHVELLTVSGHINVSRLSGKVQLSTVSGDIHDRASSGRLQLKAVSGDINSQSGASEIHVKSVSGQVELNLTQVDELAISTVSGDVEGQLKLNDSGLVKLSSVSGDMALTFPSDVQASFRLRASAGGDLVNKLTSDKAIEAKYGPNSKLDFVTGNGNGSVRGNTVSGNIKVSSR
ncbi:DUF4097 family beta strand repeat-containing protein [Thalassomonas haliotis]|uniref:DUF4097 family beta strand repeat protein n=1 Tax=Thalassomonas haliotis TaxID=485448 RepID=A0ABY7VBW2_9GAMM|nr:DUF4097 family beta strand repeat-containing protein [Thalassomonas haliotis]WDE11133.1 DUF4097 family beta strand repeat protein [Thalassomonas haliotis]